MRVSSFPDVKLDPLAARLLKDLLRKNNIDLNTLHLPPPKFSLFDPRVAYPHLPASVFGMEPLKRDETGVGK